MDKELIVPFLVSMKDVKAKKSWGQNFLRDESILQRISDSLEITEKDLILEIGPGMGALTKYLVQKTRVLAYEIDERMKPYLTFSNLQVYYQDFLKSDLQEVKQETYQNLYVVANIPYYITTPIIEHFIKQNLIPKGMVLLVQKEVAERFAALPGTKDYGYFTVFLHHYFEIKKLFDVSPNCFVPPPKVVSSVIQFRQKEKREQIDEQAFFRFVKQAFCQKRKTLKNNLREYDWEKIEPILLKNGYDKTVRAENLSYDFLVFLFKSL